MKLSPQHQDAKAVELNADMKSESIQLSDLEAFRSSSSKISFSKPENPEPLSVPTNASSYQKQQPLMRTGESTHYMKPTSSSDAKKKLFPTSLRHTQSDSNYKNQPPKISSNLKGSSDPSKQLVTTETGSTKNPSFKPSRVCSRKSSRVALSGDVNAQRATCSSTMKYSLSPACHMLNPGANESEGTSVLKVCPYTFCSLNGHRHATLPPPRNFLSARRQSLKTQKSMKQEALSLPRLKVPFETKDSDIEQIVVAGKPASNNAEMDLFFEIYAEVQEDEAKPTAADHGDEMGKLESSKELEDQEVIESAREDDIKQITTSMSDESPVSEINLEEDLKKYCDDVLTEADTMQSFLQKQNVDSAGEFHLTSMRICCSEIRNDGEELDSIEMDGSDSEATSMEWEAGQLYTSKHEEEGISAVLTEEETELKVESSSDDSLEVSVKSDDILSNCNEDILVGEALQEVNARECACFEAQSHRTVLDLEHTDESTDTQEIGYISNGFSCNQCSLIEEVFQDLTILGENGGKNETFVDDEVNCATEILNEGQEHISLKDGTTMPMSAQIYDASEGCELNQVESATDEGSRNMELKNTEIYQDVAKQLVQSIGYGNQDQKISEPVKTDEANEDRNSSPETDDGSIKLGTQIQLNDVHNEITSAAEDQKLLEENESEDKTSKNRRRAMRHKIPVEDDKEQRKFNLREPNFLPLIPDLERGNVILKHQMMDERKSAEEWMLDYALRQAVTKLAPVRKSKVALLVEAFETVMPIPKWQTHLRNNSAFAHARTIQS